MNNTSQLSAQDFESLLNWFSTDSEEAGIEYENIRAGLVRFFRFRGCSDSQTLADETINRVAKKLDKLDVDNDLKKITIFYGFAINIFREYLREVTKTVGQSETKFFALGVDGDDDDDNLKNELECLKKCLNQLPKEDKSLITKYFREDKGKKIELRKKLSGEYKITPNALHVRVYRIRQRLKISINKCMEK